MNKFYILQKDLPNVPKEAIFEANCFGNYCCIGLPNLIYNKEVVENNPSWFKIKEEIFRPPLGVMPEKLWREHRLSDLHEAVKRYREADKQIPFNWQIEINKLNDEIIYPNRKEIIIKEKSLISLLKDSNMEQYIVAHIGLPNVLNLSNVNTDLSNLTIVILK